MQRRPAGARTVRSVVAVGAMLAALTTACSGAGPGGIASGTSSPSSPATPDATGSAGSDRPAPTSAASSDGATPALLTSDPLHAVSLVDVRTGERLTIGQLAAQKPLLLETMAIWCSNCRAQQHNVVAAHNQAEFHSVSLDVDPGEQPADLATYAEREGFDWHFAMADAEILAQLRERFGTAVGVPPTMPKILFRPDGSIELIGLGELYTAQQIADAVNS